MTGDGDAVAAALAGRQAGYAYLMDTHREAVFRTLRAYTGNETEALDLTQESFVAAFLALRRYDPLRPFRAWILRIALNKCHDWSRRRAVRRLLTFARPLEEALSEHGTDATPEGELASRQEVARIHAELAALPQALKEPLILCAIEGFSQEDAARLLGISRKAVETRIYRARRKLAHLVEG